MLTERIGASGPSSVLEFQAGRQIGKRRWEIPYLSPGPAGWEAHRATLDARLPFRDFEVSRRGTDGSEHFIALAAEPMFDANGAFLGYRGVGTDIGARKGREMRHLREQEALIALTGTERADGQGLEAALRAITQTNARTLGIARVSIWRFSPDRSAIQSVDIYDAPTGRHSNTIELRAQDYPAYFRALDEMDVIAADDPYRDPRTRELSQSYLAPLGITSMMEAPIRLGGAAYGVLCHEHVGPRREWQADEKTFAVATANLVSLAIESAERMRAEEQIRGYVAHLERAFMRTVGMATMLSEMRDPYTAGHERRVAEIAVAIGAELGFDARRQEGLRVAGHLHDIGKITVPTEILAKPGKLSTAEFALIKGHAQASHDVLKEVEFPWPVAEVALQHHERLDGSGYPQGLKGEAILLEARIMAVADVVEAMSSHRPYRPGLGIEKALAEIERGRGNAYDPAVADACLKLFREKGYAIPA